MAELEIIGAAQSNYVWVVRIAAAEKGVAYKFTPVRPHTPEVDAIHPFGKIPVMRHGDLELFESKAICTYIDRAFQGHGIGKRLIEETRRAAGGAQTTTLLLSAPTAMTFYQGIKMPHADNCFLYRREK